MTSVRSSRRGLAWARVRDSLWFVPTLAVLAGTALAVLAVQLPSPRSESRFVSMWLFGGGAEGARGVLTAIAGSLITVTGTVFSVTIVALQLASSQFTPRLLRSFVADRVNQGVLGVFIGTFTYTLLVLRTIRSTTGADDSFVPQVGVSIALILLLVSIGALIVFIDHAAQSIRAPVILHRETERALAHVAVLFPERVGEPEASDDVPDPDAPSGPPGLVVAAQGGYLQAIHAEDLWRIGSQRRGAPITIRMELHIGAFAFPGKPIASVWPADAADDATVAAIREAFVFAFERTPEQDVELGIVELSDIAVKALSPGINDPTTAMQCIDRLLELLASLAARRKPAAWRRSPDGSVHLRVRETTFERAAGLAFDQIRHFGAGNPTIAKKLLESLGDLGRVAPPALRPAVVQQIEAVLRAARREVADPIDLAAIERLAMQVLEPIDISGDVPEHGQGAGSRDR